jgi:ribosome-associated protein YbcJ (S4-like RNA binding protein)
MTCRVWAAVALLGAAAAALADVDVCVNGSYEPA